MKLSLIIRQITKVAGVEITCSNTKSEETRLTASVLIKCDRKTSCCGLFRYHRILWQFYSYNLGINCITMPRWTLHTSGKINLLFNESRLNFRPIQSKVTLNLPERIIDPENQCEAMSDSFSNTRQQNKCKWTDLLSKGSFHVNEKGVL